MQADNRAAGSDELPGFVQWRKFTGHDYSNIVENTKLRPSLIKAMKLL